MAQLTELQQRVFDEAKSQLEDEPWFKGICMDNFPEDVEISENFDDAVTGVVLETSMWDDPDFNNLDWDESDDL